MSARGFSGYHGETRPDEKIGSERKGLGRKITTGENRAVKKRANAKRRARDKLTGLSSNGKTLDFYS